MGHASAPVPHVTDRTCHSPDHPADAADRWPTVGRGKPASRPSAPLPDIDVHDVTRQALRGLASRRGLLWEDTNAASRLRLIGSLVLSLSLELEDAVLVAADDHLSDADIGLLAGLSIREVRGICDALTDDASAARS